VSVDRHRSLLLMTFGFSRFAPERKNNPRQQDRFENDRNGSSRSCNETRLLSLISALRVNVGPADFAKGQAAV
jgi:hypothetical protein